MISLATWLATIFTALACVIGFISWRQRRVKRLSYHVLASGRLISSTDFRESPQLTMLFGDKALRDPRFLQVQITNSGNAEIRADDFERPILKGA